MIKNISIKNFKCLKDISIQCQNLTILTGLNGMGKSTLIQFLLILRQSYEKGLLQNGEKFLSLGEYKQNNYISLGNYEDVIYRLFEDKEDYIQSVIKFSNSELSIKTASYKHWVQDSSIERSNLKHIKLKEISNKPNLKKESLFAKGKFQFIQADRIGPQDTLPADYEMVNNKDFGIDGKYAMHYFLENSGKKIPISQLIHHSSSENVLGVQIDAWLNEISPGVRVKSIFHPSDATQIIPLFDYNTGGLPKKPFKAKNIGFGVSYIFSVVLAILTAEPDDLIIIENPEAHLHPRGQSNLAQLMAIAAQNGVQIFVETHSDHIINGTLVACKKGLISNENINIQYFERKPENLYSDNIEVKVLEKGRIKYAPEGFFDQIAKDLRFLMTSQK